MDIVDFLLGRAPADWRHILPELISSVAGKNEAVEVVTVLIVPICAFFVRVVIGQWYFENRDQYFWQCWMFYAAIFYFVIVETALILFGQVANAVQANDWYMLGIMYAIYLAAMAISLFPLRGTLGSHGRQSQESRDAQRC